MKAATQWIANRWRQSLLLSLTVTGVVGVAVLVLVVSEVVGKQVQTDALAQARWTAEILGRSTFAPSLPPDGGPLSARAKRTLDAQVAAARASEAGTQVILRDGRGAILYASRGAVPLSSLDASGTRVLGRGRDRRIHTTLPVRAPESPKPAAYLQLDVPYGPVAQEISDRTRRLDIVLVLAGLVIYLLALPGLLRAGRAVRSQYDPRRVQLARDIKRAIKRREISLAYQPIVNARTGELRSVEALVRWTDPRRGAISPGVFIPPLEQTDAIWDLTAYIFDIAFRQCAEWCDEGRRICIAVNVSGAVLLDKRLVPELQRLAKLHKVPARMLEIEITEGAMVQDPREAARVLERISEIGLRVIAIDDFGTGYSSLARLHELPLDTLKIDQSFVMRMAGGGDAAVVRSVVELAHALRLDVIAEGVEDEDTAERLLELGAECLQGYCISRPIPAPELEQWVDARVESVA